RGQAGDGPVITLRHPRDREAIAAVMAENLQDFFRLRFAQKLFEARDIFESQLRRFRTLCRIPQDRLALHPLALLLEIQESPQACGSFGAGARTARCAHVTRFAGFTPKASVTGRPAVSFSIQASSPASRASASLMCLRTVSGESETSPSSSPITRSPG